MIKYLEKEFTKHGNKIKRVASGKGWYIYKVLIPMSDEPSKYSVHYEYFQQRFRQNPWKGEFEQYPWDNAFGFWAWCCTSLDYALRDIKRRRHLKSKI